MLQVLTENAHIKGVETNIGTVFCEYFVNCAGMVRKLQFLEILWSKLFFVVIPYKCFLLILIEILAVIFG